MEDPNYRAIRGIDFVAPAEGSETTRAQQRHRIDLKAYSEDLRALELVRDQITERVTSIRQRRDKAAFNALLAGYSEADVARMAGVHRSTITRIIDRQVDPIANSADYTWLGEDTPAYEPTDDQQEGDK